MSEGGAALIWSPFGDEDSAAAIASQLLDEGLIAYANLMPIRSLYIWNGERGEGRFSGLVRVIESEPTGGERGGVISRSQRRPAHGPARIHGSSSERT